AEGASLQRGMNFRLGGRASVILMSLRKGAPYADRIEDNGQTLIYEGHDVSRTKTCGNPKLVDQPWETPSGKPTQNKMFFEAAMAAKQGGSTPENVRVYEKIRDGVWTYAGMFALVEAWQETLESRRVFKFKLRVINDAVEDKSHPNELTHNRLIPTAIKIQVWKRDQGRCVMCGSCENLHFDHVIPFSMGGSSLVVENVQLLCAKHNLQKHDSII
ncbi:MAG TPA: HNH endonuclease, partial [Candidatus Acidoferrales bacterium]|nr:HNH endonuclease [Candidatus Acidoferrales bacterium]